MRQYIYWIGPYRYNWHEELEIMLILKGQVELSCGGVAYCLEEDDLIVIDSNVGHASLARSEGSIAMVIHLDPSYLRCITARWRITAFLAVRMNTPGTADRQRKSADDGLFDYTNGYVKPFGEAAV